MADGLENRGEEDLRAASSMLVFSALVVPAPGAADRAEDDGPEDEGPDDDGPDDFERNVATVAAQIARLGLSLPTLERISCDLQPSADAAWGKLAARLRGDFPGLSDLHFAGTVLTAVEAIREVALFSAGNDPHRFERPSDVVRARLGRRAGTSGCGPGAAAARYRQAAGRVPADRCTLGRARRRRRRARRSGWAGTGREDARTNNPPHDTALGTISSSRTAACQARGAPSVACPMEATHPGPRCRIGPAPVRGSWTAR